MEFQLHPASPRGAVRRFALNARGEKAAAAVVGLAAALAGSLWVTVPTLALRALRREAEPSAYRDLVAALQKRRDLEKRAAGLRDRALDAGDRVSRVAFLYGIAPAVWPRSLNPETGVLAGNDPARLARGCDRYLSGLRRGLALVEEAETGDPDLALRTPSRLPLQSDLVEPSAFFGPRVSPWTGTEEFFPGVDLAAPSGSEVIAPADGTVIFAGHAKAAPVSRLTRFGNLVVLSHGSAGETLYGHLGRLEVRRGERVRRGQRLGTVGATGWALSPGLHYEYWRRGGEGKFPTDPLFAILDRRISPRDISLETMRATSAPAGIEPPPAW